MLTTIALLQKLTYYLATSNVILFLIIYTFFSNIFVAYENSS